MYRVSEKTGFTTSEQAHTFVQNQQFATTYDCSRKGQNLALTHREITTSAGDSSIQCNLIPVRVHVGFKGEKASSAQCIVQLGVIMLLEWI